ncbi:MAG: hypothetical protein JO144_12660 [Actinobacteria bacterium]|nr:hypothetical protein [Actinomycetota bacterium]
MSRPRPGSAQLASQSGAGRPDRRPGAAPGLLALGYLLFTAAGAMTAAVEVLLVPSRLGQTLIPLAPALAVLSNIALPLISRGLTGTRASALPPYLGWLAATLVLAGARPEGDVLLPAGDAAYISYSLLVLGTLAGAITVALANRSVRVPGSVRRGRAGSGSDGAR